MSVPPDASKPEVAPNVAEELEKAASMVTTARRLLGTGTMVDLSALEGKVRAICEALAGMARDDGRPLLPMMERLIRDLDRLAEAITDRMEPPPSFLANGGATGGADGGAGAAS